MTLSQSSTVIFRTVLSTVMPALLTRMSSCPCRSRTSPMVRTQSSLEPMLPWWTLASTPWPRSQFASKAQWADLDVLCLTAMHKDPARRYASVEALERLFSALMDVSKLDAGAVAPHLADVVLRALQPLEPARDEQLGRAPQESETDAALGRNLCILPGFRLI